MKDYLHKEHNSEWTQLSPTMRRKLIRTDNLMMVVVEFSGGPATEPDPFHDHPHEQVSYVAGGELTLYVQGVGEEKLVEGDMFAVPSGVPHTVKILTPTVRIIDCFTPIREEFLSVPNP